MKDSNNIINNLTANKFQQPSTISKNSETFSETQKSATAYFYNQLKSIYGRQFSTEYPSLDDLKSSQRQWATDIGDLTPEQMEAGFRELKKLMIECDDEYNWPSVPKIIGLMLGYTKKGTHWQHAGDAYKISPPSDRLEYKPKPTKKGMTMLSDMIKKL